MERREPQMNGVLDTPALSRMLEERRLNETKGPSVRDEAKRH